MPTPRVPHGDQHFIGESAVCELITRRRGRSGNVAHRFDAIQDQIHDHLLQLDPVAHSGGKIGGEFGLERNLVSQCRPFHQNAHFANQIVDLHVRFSPARPW